MYVAVLGAHDFVADHELKDDLMAALLTRLNTWRRSVHQVLVVDLAAELVDDVTLGSAESIYKTFNSRKSPYQDIVL